MPRFNGGSGSCNQCCRPISAPYSLLAAIHSQFAAAPFAAYREPFATRRRGDDHRTLRFRDYRGIFLPSTRNEETGRDRKRHEIDRNRAYRNESGAPIGSEIPPRGKRRRPRKSRVRFHVAAECPEMNSVVSRCTLMRRA
jgi:hypothetical protein